MPTLHRLATLRDDVIFFIWIYQSWKYKVDYKRVNEFGQGGEDGDEVEDVPQQKAVEHSPPAEATTQVTARASGSGSSNTFARKRN